MALQLDSPQATLFASVLRTVQATELPVYAEIADDRISAIVVPVIGSLVELTPSSSGDILVTLNTSATQLVLHANVANHDELLERLHDGLTAAQQENPTRETAVVTRIGSAEIIYVEVIAKLPHTGCPPVSAPRPQVDIVRALTPLKRGDIEQRVARLVQRTCDADLTAPDCIPFTYVSSYCWHRAHAVCTDLAQDNITSAKLWVYAKNKNRRLQVPTDCLLEGVTDWIYHVVAVVCTEQFDIRVIDPSLFRQGSVPLSAFIQMMRPAASFAYTDMHTYLNFPNGRTSPACPEDVRRDSLSAMAHLQLMKTLPEGPPPYESARIGPV
jgi:hypothetical protein